jgi:CRISPR/Cas system-associated endonuclease Cas1
MSVISPSRRSRYCCCGNSGDAFSRIRITGSPRLAANPANAILNYLYTVFESEATLAVAALGLDPALASYMFDTKARDSLAFDVLEPIRHKLTLLC